MLTTGAPLNSWGILHMEILVVTLSGVPQTVGEQLGLLVKLWSPSFHGGSICTIDLKSSLKAMSLCQRPQLS